MDHSDQVFRFSATVTGLPEIGDVLAAHLDAEAHTRETRRGIAGAIGRRDWDAALAAVDASLSERPGDVGLLRSRFRILATGREDREAAVRCGDEILQAAHDNATTLNNFAWALLTDDQYGGAYADVALKLSQRSNELTRHKNWMFVDTLALARFETGDVQDAIELEKQAIELSGGRSSGALKAALARFETAGAASPSG